MAQIWVGMHSIKESLRLLESNAAEEDWDTRYWTWVDREILAEAAALAEGTEQDVEPVALDSAAQAVDADVQPGLSSGPALAAEADLHSGPALAVEADLHSGPALAVEADLPSGPALAAEADLHSGPALAAEAELHSGPALAVEQADVRPAQDADGHAFEVPGLPALAPGPAAEMNRALTADSDRALAALATQLTVPAIAADMTVPVAAVEAAPDPDHGLPVDRGPDEAGNAVPAPVLASVKVRSSGSKEEIQRKLDDYADNVTVAENSELWNESYAPGHALEKFSLDEIPVPKVKDHVAGMATKPPEPETPAFVSDPIVKKPAEYELRGDVIEV